MAIFLGRAHFGCATPAEALRAALAAAAFPACQHGAPTQRTKKALAERRLWVNYNDFTRANSPQMVVCGGLWWFMVVYGGLW